MMKSSPFWAAGALLAFALVTAGCSTGITPAAQTQARIREKSATYNALTPTQQKNILGGAIERGNTTEMVYMAMGKPQKIVTSADGVKAMWIYVEYYNQNAVFGTSINVAGASYHYATGQTSEMAPAGGNSRSSRAADFHGTNNITPVQSIDLPDMKTSKVYVFYHLGKVVEIKVEGDVPGQAAAQPATGKRSLNVDAVHHG